MIETAVRDRQVTLAALLRAASERNGSHSVDEALGAGAKAALPGGSSPLLKIELR